MADDVPEPRRPKHHKEPPSVRRASATPPELTAGRDFYRAVCPCCGFSRPVMSKNKGPVRFDLLNPATSEFIQVRRQHKCEAGWVSKGFPKVEGAGLTLAQAAADPFHKPVFDRAVAQIIRVYEYLASLGLVE